MVIVFSVHLPPSHGDKRKAKILSVVGCLIYLVISSGLIDWNVGQDQPLIIAVAANDGRCISYKRKNPRLSVTAPRSRFRIVFYESLALHHLREGIATAGEEMPTRGEAMPPRGVAKATRDACAPKRDERTPKPGAT